MARKRWFLWSQHVEFGEKSVDLERTFTVIVEKGSLNKAAEALGIANSTISTRLLMLEKQLNATLLERNARGIKVTEIGRVYYDNMRRAVAIADEAVDLVKKMATGSYGTLTLNIPPGLVELWLSKPIASFLSENPNVHVDIKTSDNILANIHKGFDISFHWGRLPDRSLYAQKIFEDEVLVVATGSYIKKNDLINHPENIEFLQLTREYGGETKRMVAPRKDMEWVYGHPSKVTSDNVECIIAFLAESIGAAVLPKSYVADKLHEKEILDITSLYFSSSFSLPCYAITLEKPSRSSRTSRLIETIKLHYK